MILHGTFQQTRVTLIMLRLIASSILLSGFVLLAGNAQATKLSAVSYGTISAVSKQDKDSSGDVKGGAIIGGLIGLATSGGRSTGTTILRTGVGAAGGAALGAAAGGGTEIIDYGCGTGLVGRELRHQGFQIVDGVDISTGMLQRAREKDVYQNLVCCDLTAETALEDEIYDVAVCVGSMGAGHVGVQHVAELLRPLRTGGLFIITINNMHFAPEGFEQAFRYLETSGLWKIVLLEEFNYMTQLERPGWLLLAEKT